MRNYIIILAALLLTNSISALTEKIYKPLTPSQLQTIQECRKNNPGQPCLTSEMEQSIFSDDDMPLPHTGVKVMPSAKIHYPAQYDATIRSNLRSFKKDDYNEQFSPDAAMLLDIRNLATYDLAANDVHGRQDPHSTHMRRNLADLDMAYLYQGTNNAITRELIGYAVSGSYENRPGVTGWNGASEYFIFDKVLNCSYNQNNLELTGTSAQLPEEIVTYDVNKKVTIIESDGNNDSGYSYKVEWWDNKFRHILTCASKEFIQEYKKSVIDMAIKIDLG